MTRLRLKNRSKWKKLMKTKIAPDSPFRVLSIHVSFRYFLQREVWDWVHSFCLAWFSPSEKIEGFCTPAHFISLHFFFRFMFLFFFDSLSLDVTSGFCFAIFVCKSRFFASNLRSCFCFQRTQPNWSFRFSLFAVWAFCFTMNVKWLKTVVE